MRKLLIIYLLICSTLQALAQEQLTKKQVGDKLFERYEYFKSVQVYLSIPDNQKDVQVLERIAECYRKMNNYPEAEKWYELAVAAPRSPLRISYNYAEVLLTDQKFEAAKTQYKRFFSNTRNSADLAQKLASCDSAALWVAQTGRYALENQQQLNSEFSDWGLSYYGPNSLVFVSDRMEEKSKDMYKWNGDGWLKLYQNGPAGQETEEFPLSLNNKYHVGPAAFNAARDTAYVTVNNPALKQFIAIDYTGHPTQRLYARRLELLAVTKQGGQWTGVKAFQYNSPNNYSIGHAALSANGSILYFTSDMPGGQGKTDIWYCQKQANGSWGKPVNCGKAINTKEEEAFATIGPDGTLYFSSKGLPGMGGYDIFRSRGEKANWTKPENLKYPLNSTSDDFWLATTDGLTGYFSSNRQGGKGNDDIYSFRYTPPGDSTSPPPLIATVEGPKQSIPEQVGRPVTPGALMDASKITSDQLVVGKTFILKNIYYDLDKSYIRRDAAVELDKLLVILRENPGLKIELSSHTDSRASDEYNMELSQRRAEAAVSYLVGKGVERYRLVARGYGETQLLNKCANGVDCSEEDHQLNRRTEFKVLAK